MKTTNSLIEHMDAVTARAAQLNCTVVAVANDVILCHGGGNTFITWQVLLLHNYKGVPFNADFIDGHYDMTADAAQSNLIDRAWDIHL